MTHVCAVHVPVLDALKGHHSAATAAADRVLGYHARGQPRQAQEIPHQRSTHPISLSAELPFFFFFSFAKLIVCFQALRSKKVAFSVEVVAEGPTRVLRVSDGVLDINDFPLLSVQEERKANLFLSLCSYSKINSINFLTNIAIFCRYREQQCSRVSCRSRRKSSHTWTGCACRSWTRRRKSCCSSSRRRCTSSTPIRTSRRLWK